MSAGVVRREDGSVWAYLCPRCGTGYRALCEREAQACALRCCDPRCEDCGESCAHKYMRRCKPCQTVADKRQLAKDFAAAKKVPASEYTGEHVSVDTDESGYFLSVGEMDEEDLLEVDGVRFAWGCTTKHAGVDLECQCREVWLEDHHPDAFDLVDARKLARAQKLVDEALANVKTYWTDKTVAVVVEEES